MKNTIETLAKYILLSIIAFLCVFPFLWVLSAATNTSGDVLQGKILFGKNFLVNIKQLASNTNILLGFFNSSKIAILSTILALAFNSLAGYGFQIYSSKIRERIYVILLLSMMIPFTILLVPLYKMMVIFGFYDTHSAIIIPVVANVFLIFFFRQNFKTFPRELIDAARIDGASELLIFIRIVIPSMRSVYAAAGIYAFMGSWNNFVWPLIVLQSNKQQTLTLMVSSLAGGYTPDYGVISLAVVIATLPVIVVFLLLQKQFIKGMLTGSFR